MTCRYFLGAACDCQLCQHSVELQDGLRYAEAHHLQPLGSPHDGPDIEGNVICLCPNCHVELDYGVRTLRMEDITVVLGHVIDERFISKRAIQHTAVIVESA